jgi:hypothetical protein
LQQLNHYKTAVLLGLLGTAALPAHAADTNWTGSESDYWDEPYNWSASWPYGTDTAVFDKGGETYSVTYFNQGITDAVGEIRVVSDDVTLDLNQVTLGTNSSMSGLHLVGESYGSTSQSLTLLNGTLATHRISMAEDYTGNATLTVGAGASIQGINNGVIDNSYAPHIGLNNGQLNVIDGGVLNSHSINGPYDYGNTLNSAINVSGADSKLINTEDIYLDGWSPLAVTNGGHLQTRDLYIGYAPPTGHLHDSISVDGANSNLTTTGKLVLINAVDPYTAAGPTRMSVTNGATVTANEVSVGASQDSCHIYGCEDGAGSASILIDGAEFTHTGTMDMGGNSVSSVTVSNGGTLNSVGEVALGGLNHYSGNTGKGTVTITGAGSSWNVTDGFVSLSGPSDSEINILDGATANISATDGFRMGGGYSESGDSTLNVDGAGSSFVTEGNYNTYIADGPGGGAKSTINITNGGYVELQASQGIEIARDGNAEINVSGSGSKLHLNTQDIKVSQYNVTADINISDGATLQIAHTEYGKFQLGNDDHDYGGKVTLDITNGSELDARNTNIVLGGATDGDADDVVMTVTDSTVTASDIEVHANATLIVENSNMEDSSVSIIGGHVEMKNVQSNYNLDIMIGNDGFFGGSGQLGHVDVGYSSPGTLSVGNSPGHLQVYNYRQYADGTLIMEIGGYQQGIDFDYLEIMYDNGANLDGTLTIQLLDGFNPLVGSSFELITADYISGEFSTLTLPELNGPKYFEITYDPDRVYMTVAVPIPASVWLFLSGLGFLRLCKKPDNQAN